MHSPLHLSSMPHLWLIPEDVDRNNFCSDASALSCLSTRTLCPVVLDVALLALEAFPSARLSSSSPSWLLSGQSESCWRLIRLRLTSRKNWESWQRPSLQGPYRCEHQASSSSSVLPSLGQGIQLSGRNLNLTNPLEEILSKSGEILDT